MSIRSMTGHGRATVRSKGLRVEVNVSSVNRRQLDVAVKLPKLLAAWEPRLEKVVSDYVSRGRVAGTLDVQLSGSWRRRGVCVDLNLARGYVDEIRRAARASGLKDNLGATVLLDLPEVVRYEETQIADDELWKVAEACLRAAMKKLVRMREREGRHLCRDIKHRLRILRGIVERIKKRAPEVSVRYREQLLKRLKGTGVEVIETDDRILREVALFADRIDITEEITRLESHIAQFGTWMSSREAVGRTLDFAVQEMFREANTLGAKANDIVISKLVVIVKTELERIREQVQNIE